MRTHEVYSMSYMTYSQCYSSARHNETDDVITLELAAINGFLNEH